MREPAYDSDAPPPSPVAQLAAVWERRALVRLLVTRELDQRYKRSVLGVWWTLLNPLLEMACLALVFSQIFRVSAPGVPYIVYLLSGIVTANLFRGAIMRATLSLVENRAALSRLRLPIEVFPVSSVLETLTSFLLSLVPLAAIMLITGEPIAWTAPLIVVPAALLSAFALGVGMILAPLVVRFPDTQLLLNVTLTFVTYLAPVFYPFEIVPERFRIFVEVNPLYHGLNAVRSTVYAGELGALSDYLVLGAYGLGALAVGQLVFSRASQRSVALL